MRILIACVGNIFNGDDGFGVEVAAQLMRETLPEGVRVVDFGIRSYDLMFKLEEEWDAVILVDAMSRGEPPGTVYLLEPDMADGLGSVTVDAHIMNPAQVLEMVRSLDSRRPRLFVAGCEPGVLDAEDFKLSDPVRASIPQAIAMIHRLVGDLLRERSSETVAATEDSESPRKP